MNTGRASGLHDLLRESASDLYQEAPCGFFSVLLDGTLVRGNQRMADMLGTTVRDLGRGNLRIHDFLAVGSRIYWETHVHPLLLMQDGVDEIALDLRTDGGKVPVLMNAVLRRDPSGEPIGIRATVLDASERRRYERELLRARSAAEESARLKGEVMSMVSHDMRSPLASISMAGDLLKATPLSEDQSRIVGILTSSTTKLLQLVDDILEFGSLEAGKMHLERKPLDLGKLLDELVCEVSVAAARKGLLVQTIVDDHIPSDLLGDSIKLGRILTNLLGNAVKFTDSGSVRMTARLVDSDAHHATVAFTVRDTGIGISEEQQERIFEDFTQADDDIPRKYGGSGLGLGICKRLVALHGGEIEVESTLGGGSSFSFEVTFDRAGGG